MLLLHLTTVKCCPECAAAAAALHLHMLFPMCILPHKLHELSLHGLACLWLYVKFSQRMNDVNIFVQVKKTLGWEPVVPLKEGLALMVEDFARRLGQCTASLLHTLTNTPMLCLCLKSISVCKLLMFGELISSLT